MTPAQTDSLLTIALAAAFADGTQSAEETARIRSMLPPDDADRLLERARSDQEDLAPAAAALDEPALRTQAYELAVCVIEADGHRNEAETAFLGRLANILGVAGSQASAVLSQADAIQAAAVADDPAADAAAAPQAESAETLIRNTAILAGALELLPQKLAGLAVIPVQTGLVYRLGRRHGVTLDSGHIKEFLAVAGIGMTSQMLEGVARRFLGGFIRSLAGGMAGGIARGATGPVMSFATTYALGRLADQYYAGGRKLSAIQLREAFGRMVADAQEMGEKLGPDMEARAKTLDLARLPGLIAGRG